MTSYPKNVQFTNLKINSDQDLFEINPALPVNDDDAIMNALCNNEESCLLPTLDLLPPCNNILAALKVNGSAAICKGINIGNTDTEIKGTIRFNGKNFEGYTCDGWVPLDCCRMDDNNCKIYDIESRWNEMISVGDLVTFDASKPFSDTVHKLLCDKWEWSSRISSMDNDKSPKIVSDKCGKAFVAGCTDSSILPKFYNSDETPGPNNFMMQNFSNKYIFAGKINSHGCWEYVVAIDSAQDDIDPEITVGCSGSLYLTGQQNGDNSPLIFYNYDSSIGLELTGSNLIRTFIGKLNGAGIWLWAAEIQFSDNTNISEPNISVDMCDNLYMVNNVVENSVATVYDVDKNPYPLPTSTHKQVLIALYSGDGSVNWIARVNGSTDQTDGNVMVDGFGNAYVTGIGNQPVYYNKDNQIDQTGVLETLEQLWIGKICFTGSWEWNTRITNIDTNTDGAIMANDVDCNLYLGFISNDIDVPEFYNSDNSLAIMGNNKDSIYIGKISGNGFWYWAASIVLTTPTEKNITSIDVDGNGFIYVSGDAVGDLEFYNIDGTLGESLINIGDKKYVWLGKLNAYGCWDWVIQVYGENNNFCPSVSVDGSGNVFLAGESDPTNDNIIYSDPPDNVIGIEGKGSPTGEIFVGKIVNEAQSAKMVGVVKEVLDNDQVCVQFNGEITFDGKTFIPGMSYYYDCETGSIVNYCYKNLRLLRNVGIACDSNSLLWNPTGKFCVAKEKDCNKVITSSEISGQTISGTFIYTTNPGYNTDPTTSYKATKIDNVVTLTINTSGDITPDMSLANKFETDGGALDMLFRPSHDVTTMVKIKDNGVEKFGALTVGMNGTISFTNEFGNFTAQDMMNNMIGNCTITYVI